MKKLLYITAIIWTALACRGTDRKTASESLSSAEAAQPPAAVHGMVLFGSDTIYASHIPMFHIPHDWQALFEVTLSHPTADAKAIYLQQLASGVQPLITIEPRPFVLPKLLNGEINSFEASLYRGNFEEDSERLLKGMTVTVKKVLFKAHLSTSTQGIPDLTYFLLPTSPTSAFLVHRITAPTNFDHILQVKTTDGAVPTTPRDTMSQVVFAGIADGIGVRLAPGAAIALSRGAQGWTGVVGPANGVGAMAWKVTADFYCTPGPDFAGTCN